MYNNRNRKKRKDRKNEERENNSGRKDLTEYVDATQLGFHRAGVDLAHVAIPVGLLQLTNVQAPRAVDDFLRNLASSCHTEGAGRSTGAGITAGLVGDRDTRIVRHRSRVDRQNRLVGGSQPCDLQNTIGFL